MEGKNNALGRGAERTTRENEERKKTGRKGRSVGNGEWDPPEANDKEFTGRGGRWQYT